MAEEIFASVQVRRDNKANWEAANPILLDGEAAYEKDTDMFKIGDGVNNYKNLPYHNTGASGVTKETDPTVPDWAKQPSKPTYTASEVGADAAGTAAGAVAAHNVSGAAHEDLRALIEGLTRRLNALADSDDTTLDQMSEIVSYIKNNKSLIDGITTGKISTSDIVDNLTTNVSNKVLSAAQGVKLKALVDNIIIPSVLPNPYALTINGQSYDGSAAVNITTTGGDGSANIDDTAPSTSTTYSSSKIESKLTALNDANAALIEVSKTKPNAENTELWIHPNADEVQLPQIDDSVESVQDTWSSKKIAAEVSNKANEKDLAVVAKSGSYNDLTGKPTIPIVPTTLPNPSKLILSGAVTAEYDGSSEVRVEIPTGGGSAYELPIASPTTLGGVMPAAKTDGMTQAVGVDALGGLWTMAGGAGNKVPVKLADITMEEDATLSITNDMNGEPLSEDHIFVSCITAATTNNRDINLIVNNRLVKAWALKANTTTMYHMTEVFALPDMYYAVGFAASQGYGYNKVQAVNGSVEEAMQDEVTKITRVASQMNLPVGSRIRIYSWR